MEAEKNKLPRHVAIIMDGNGRWARSRFLPRIEGHRRGLNVVRETIKAAAEFGVEYLTLYAFSSENWKRPKEEVDFLMKACESFIMREMPLLMKEQVRLRHIGRQEGLPESLKECLARAEEATKENRRLTVLLAFNYGGRGEILDAVRAVADEARAGTLVPQDITEEYFSSRLYTAGVPDPDLLIRTSGEMRVSNYLLWQIAYAEFYVTKKCWPEFTKKEFARALMDYQTRARRFGGVA